MPSRTSDTSVCAVVATYNRKSDLTDCLDSLCDVPELDAIVVVDGYSTDGTGAHLHDGGYVDERAPEDGEGHWETTSVQSGVELTYLRFFSDFGGAGSFHHGMARAYADGHDYVWVMDDDVEVREDSLAALVDRAETLATETVDVGFVCSKVCWTDGSVHRMNVPEVATDGAPFNSYDDQDVLRVRSCSFVSALFTREAIEDVGLPRKEFFIYNDDVEFTQRLTSNGYEGLYTPRSVVYHRTETNTGVDIYSDDSTMKHYYSTRNSLYLLKQESLPKYVALLLYYLFVRTVLLYVRRDRDRTAFAKVNLEGTLDSLRFDPPIHHVE